MTMILLLGLLTLNQYILMLVHMEVPETNEPSCWALQVFSHLWKQTALRTTLILHGSLIVQIKALCFPQRQRLNTQLYCVVEWQLASYKWLKV